VYYLRWSPDGQWLASAGQDNTVKVWDAAIGREVFSIPCGTRLSKEEFAHLSSGYDSQTGADARALWVEDGEPLAWAPDGQRLAVASPERLIQVWDMLRKREVVTLSGHRGRVRTLAWHPNGRHVASGSMDGMIKVWDPASGQEVLTLWGHTGWVNAVAWSPEGRRVASASDDRTIKIWDVTDGTEWLTLRGHRAAVAKVAWSADGWRLFSTSFDNTARIWDTVSEQEALSLRTRGRIVHLIRSCELAWVADSQLLAGDASDCTAWDVVTGEEIPIPEDRARKRLKDAGHSTGISPDGQRMAVTQGEEIQIIQATDNRVVQARLPVGHRGIGGSLAWSPDGRQLASGYVTGTIKVWDTTTGVEIATLRGHGAMVNSLAWSPDGRRLASGSWDRTAKMWDVATWEEVLTLGGHQSEVRSVTWSPKGTWLATASSDGTIKVWDAGARKTPWKPDLARAKARLAWQLALCADPAFRDPQRTLDLAKGAIDLEPGRPAFWRTLAIASYRKADWKGTIQAEEKAKELLGGSTSFDDFLLAMAHWQLGAKEQARRSFDEGARSMDKYKPQDEVLLRFRAEAAALLGINDPAPRGKEGPPPK
jgi:WD40 repeat protein